MPVPLTTAWDAVRATAIACGSLKVVADHHHISYTAVKMRASREQWPVGRRIILAAKKAQQDAEEATQRARQQDTRQIADMVHVAPVTSTAEVLENEVKAGRDTFRTKASTAIAKAATHAAEQPGDKLLKGARALKDLVDAGSKLHGLDRGDSIQIAFLNVRFD